MGFEKAIVHLDSGPQVRLGTRNHDRIEFDDPKLATDLWARCRPFLTAEIEGGEAFALDDHFRFYRYDVGQRFKRHKDGMTTRSATERSRLSCLFYLNGGFSGGETVFYSDEYAGSDRKIEASVTPQAGDVLFFRHEWWHEGKELLVGRKYVLRTDVYFRFPEGLSPKSNPT